jgi:small ligand-binding sensory domain FIST
MVNGHEGSVVEIVEALDEKLGAGGAVLAAQVDGCSGMRADNTRASAPGGSPSLELIAVQTPPAAVDGPPSEVNDALTQAQPFFIGKQQLLEISSIILRLQARTRVKGASLPSTPRAWHNYLGAEEGSVKGIILFVDPLATKYTVSQVLSGLDLAFPHAVKFGGTASDIEPGKVHVAVGRPDWWKGRGKTHASSPKEAGVVGLLLPSSVALHTIVASSAMAVGPELQVTKAEKQVIKEINEVPSAEALTQVLKEASPTAQRDIYRDGFLLGFEAPEQSKGFLDASRSKVYDDTWGTSDRAPSYAKLAKLATSSDWLLRSHEDLPDGTILVRRDDLKQVPPRVGPRWLRMQLHISDRAYAKKEMRRMLQCYAGARMMMAKASPPFGALACVCKSVASKASAEGEEEVSYADTVASLFGDQLPIASATVCGEIAPQGVTLGGINERRTARHGHTASCCFFSYEP